MELKSGHYEHDLKTFCFDIPLTQQNSMIQAPVNNTVLSSDYLRGTPRREKRG